jgi:hypothetical protein
MKMANMFRFLRADEIDVRIGNTNKTKTKANLLLYKDARCDQNVLDETVGPYNWQRSHSRENANCIVSIWDKEKGQWISKEDTGTESKTEAEKGLASDSFKRACFNWGIGRELYTAPAIWVPYDPNKYESYTVAEIGYDKNGVINVLAIANKSGNIIFKYGNTTSNFAPIQTEPAPDDAVSPEYKIPEEKGWNRRDAMFAWCQHYGINAETFGKFRDALVGAGIVENIPSKQMSVDQFNALCTAIQQNFGDQLVTA